MNLSYVFRYFDLVNFFFDFPCSLYLFLILKCFSLLITMCPFIRSAPFLRWHYQSEKWFSQANDADCKPAQSWPAHRWILYTYFSYQIEIYPNPQMVGSVTTRIITQSDHRLHLLFWRVLFKCCITLPNCFAPQCDPSTSTPVEISHEPIDTGGQACYSDTKPPSVSRKTIERTRLTRSGLICYRHCWCCSEAYSDGLTDRTESTAVRYYAL